MLTIIDALAAALAVAVEEPNAGDDKDELGQLLLLLRPRQANVARKLRRLEHALQGDSDFPATSQRDTASFIANAFLAILPTPHTFLSRVVFFFFHFPLSEKIDFEVFLWWGKR